MHISYQTYWKQYIQGQSLAEPPSIGDFWIELAAFIRTYVFMKDSPRLLALNSLSPAQQRLVELAQQLPDDELAEALNTLEQRAKDYTIPS